VCDDVLEGFLDRRDTGFPDECPPLQNLRGIIGKCFSERNRRHGNFRFPMGEGFPNRVRQVRPLNSNCRESNQMSKKSFMRLFRIPRLTIASNFSAIALSRL